MEAAAERKDEECDEIELRCREKNVSGEWHTFRFLLVTLCVT